MGAPPVFSALSFSEAVAHAKDAQRLLLVDFTAEWCPPCRTMDHATWTSPVVAEWIEKNALAVQVDVDADSQTAQRFGVKSMPTMLLLRGEEVLDRVSGYRPPEQVLEWVRNASVGKREVDLMRAALEPTDLNARLKLVEHLLEVAEFAEAAEHLEFLWLRGLSLEPTWLGVRSTFLPGFISSVSEQSASARARFLAIRDQTIGTVDGPEPRRDWMSLNEALGESAATLAWFDEVKARPPRWLERESRMIELLISHERWADLGRLLTDPLADLARQRKTLELVRRQAEEDAAFAHGVDFFVERVRDRARVLVRALREAGRDEWVERVRADAVAHDESEAMRDATR